MDPITELLRKIEVLPASPALLPKLAGTLNNVNHANVHEIVDIVMYDSTLTAKLLQIANSAYFGHPNPVTTVGEAISQVGYDTVYLLAASINGQNSLRTPPGTGLDTLTLWKHSVLTAFGAQHVAKAAGLDGNLMFTAGLLHDLGKVVFAGAKGKDYTIMLDPAKRGPLTLVEWETTRFGCHHAEIGAALLERWKLPAPIVAAVRFHHQPSGAGEYAPLAACVCLGNALSRLLDEPAFALDPANLEVPPALQFLNLTPADLGNQWQRIRDNWEFVQTLYQMRM